MGKRNKYAAPAVSEARVSELASALDADVLDSPLSDAEVAALVEHLGAAERAVALVALRERVQSKDQRKAVNKALYALEQRGVEVPEHKVRPAPISFALEPIDDSDLPVLIGPPLTEATRFVLLPYLSDRTLYQVRLGFSEPVGLVSLDGSVAARSILQRIMRDVLARPHSLEDPGFVDAGRALGLRKLWEAGRLLRLGRFGAEIDHDIREVLVFPQEAPPHPADELDLSGVAPFSAVELYDYVDSGAAVAPVLHTSLRVAVQEGYRAAPGSAYDEDAESILRAESIERRCTEELVERWGLPAVCEVFKDAAVYWSLVGEPRIAVTYLEIAREPDDAVLRTRVERFIMAILAHVRRIDGAERRAAVGRDE
jgi:hypothetical protein